MRMLNRFIGEFLSGRGPRGTATRTRSPRTTATATRTGGGIGSLVRRFLR